MLEINKFDGLPPEMLRLIFSFMTAEECAKCREISKKWLPHAEQVAKEKLIESFEISIENKAANFLKMIPGRLHEFCPTYAANLNQIRANHASLSLKQIYEQLNKLTEKYHVFIDEISEPELEEKEAALFGKEFVRLNYRLMTSKDPAFKNGDVLPWGEFPSMKIAEMKSMFPLKIFAQNLKSASYPIHACFPLKGRLIELVLESPPQEIDKTLTAKTYPEIVYRSKDAYIDPNELSSRKKILDRLKSKGLVPVDPS